MNKKETFSELYARLYKENFAELEELRKNENKTTKTIVKITVLVVLSWILMCNLAIYIPFTIKIMPLFLILVLIKIIAYVCKLSKGMDEVNKKVERSYKDVFKEKIVAPLIEYTLEGAKYKPNEGMSNFDYGQADFNDESKIYYSDNMVLAPLKIKGQVVTSIRFAEVRTELAGYDNKYGVTPLVPFHGIVGSFLIKKPIGKNVYIRSNRRVVRKNKKKIEMDMSEFEKIFDVESEDKVLAVRILTSEVMAEMIELYKKYKYKFEINIIDDTVYMRLSTGTIFETGMFKKAIEYKQIAKYYMVLKALTSIASRVYEITEKLEV